MLVDFYGLASPHSFSRRHSSETCSHFGPQWSTRGLGRNLSLTSGTGSLGAEGMDFLYGKVGMGCLGS